VRSPLRRKLVRTLLKNRGLTTGSLIEGEREKGSLVFKKTYSLPPLLLFDLRWVVA
jgi:hypothetical protein